MPTSDFIIITAIRAAITKVKEETGITISEEDALDIINYQSKAVKEAFNNKDTVKLDYIGKFLIKPGREEGLAASKAAAELGLKGEELKNFLRKAKLDNDTKRPRGQSDGVNNFVIDRMLTDESSTPHTS